MQMTDNVTPKEAIKRSIDAYAREKSSFYEAAIRPLLDDLAVRIVQDLDAFNYEIKKK
jgi:hypothetical protein